MIKVVVKSSSGEIPTGTYQASFDEKNLLLQHKNKPEVFRIPVGVGATKRLKSATIDVSSEDSHLSFEVKGLRIDQSSLANSIANFLTGKSEAPDLSKYSSPGVLFGLAFLPFILPILTRGGAIPGGIAGMLFMVCIGIAKQNNQSFLLRFWTIISVSAIGVVGTYLGLLFMFGML